MDTHLFKHMMDLAENEYHQKNLLNATYDKTDPKKVKAVLRKAPNKIARANVELERKRIRQSNISEDPKDKIKSGDLIKIASLKDLNKNLSALHLDNKDIKNLGESLGKEINGDEKLT